MHFGSKNIADMNRFFLQVLNSQRTTAKVIASKMGIKATELQALRGLNDAQKAILIGGPPLLFRPRTRLDLHVNQAQEDAQSDLRLPMLNSAYLQYVREQALQNRILTMLQTGLEEVEIDAIQTLTILELSYVAAADMAWVPRMPMQHLADEIRETGAGSITWSVVIQAMVGPTVADITGPAPYNMVQRTDKWGQQ
jgi:hypothetical protein